MPLLVLPVLMPVPSQAKAGGGRSGRQPRLKIVAIQGTIQTRKV